MAPATLFISFLLANLAVLHSAQDDRLSKRCPPYFCNDEIGNISFPFKYKQHPSECGLYSVDCTENNLPLIQLKEGDKYWYGLTSISATNNVSAIINKDLKLQLETKPCDDQVIADLTLPSTSPVSDLSAPNNLIVFKCLDDQNTSSSTGMRLACTSDHPYHYYIISSAYVPSLPPGCSVILLPFLPGWNISNQPQNISVDNFSLQVTVSEECLTCHNKGDICNTYNGKFICQTPKGENLKSKLGLCIGLGVTALLAACLLILWCYTYRHKDAAHSDLEDSSVYLGVPVFTYKELDEATDHFNSDKQIGDGGFGVVYYGKLKDGREVAVKRLYEHNYKRAEQFMNEIEILTHLRHKNLVTLYGCSPHHSRDLLLVYEYIAKGTVADHLHGDRAATGSLTWPIRMSIARETASALCYLHASDIVHRDVKTANILLDENFTVKVADFGISRFFPLDVTHVSTAPQGTPGYVDPEYHKCYRLTPKTDVYSFGVVLIELISSLPAVDITRHKEEINLSNIAINRIENGLYDELMDTSLGFETDHEVKRMMISVADLAFQCLQQDSDARPTMSEVLEVLKKIKSRNEAPKTISAAFCDAGMAKSMQLSPSHYSDRINYRKAQSSPNSVMQTWTSSSSTHQSSSADSSRYIIYV